MKGAILTVCPEATLVDISHEIPAHDVAAGALTLEAACDSFPPATVFLAVVDPGVGSERRPIALAAGRFLFVGPDNGLFTFLLDAQPLARVRLIANPILRRPRVSPVFQGRDIFGPAAGHLARELALDEVGPVVPDPVRLALPAKTCGADGCLGVVVRADRFGNLVTNLLEKDLDSLAAGGRQGFEIVAGGLTLPLVRAYSDVPIGSLCALIGSSSRLEIAIRQGRADGLPQLATGVAVSVHRAG
jgi:hypothetical protein